jgi:hypothetical protein
MPEDNEAGKAIATVKRYFSTEEKPVTNGELIALKRADKKGNVFTMLAKGINDGSFTY